MALMPAALRFGFGFSFGSVSSLFLFFFFDAPFFLVAAVAVTVPHRFELAPVKITGVLASCFARGTFILALTDFAGEITISF